MKKLLIILTAAIVLFSLTSCALLFAPVPAPAPAPVGPRLMPDYIEISATDINFTQKGMLFLDVSKADARIHLSNTDITKLNGKVGHIVSTPIKTSEYSVRTCYKIDFEDGSVLYYGCEKPSGSYKEIFDEAYTREVWR